MRLSNTIEVDNVKEANRLIREAIRMNAINPLIGKIDMEDDQYWCRCGAEEAKSGLEEGDYPMMGCGNTAKRGIKWAEVLNTLNQQSSVRVDPGEFAEVVKLLELEGLVKILGERERMVIRRVSSD